MKRIISAAVIAVLGIAPAFAQDYGYRHNYAVPQLPRVPQAPQAPRAPEPAGSYSQNYTPYHPVQPYQGLKPQKHFNPYTNRWESDD